MKKTVVKLNKISKEFPIKLNTFFSYRKPKIVHALKDINLTVSTGDRIGIVGANGSGKTTLLKIMSGITAPTSGEIEISGKIVSIMKIEAGFNLDLTGYENLRLNGLLAGMSTNDIKSKTRQIIKFSELHKHMESPLYTYSDGMRFRLALAIALASDCDALFIDEVIVSGDIGFQEKIINTINTIQKTRNTATVITSHIPSFVWAFSDKFYKMVNGKIEKVSYTKMESEVRRVDYTWRQKILNKK